MAGVACAARSASTVRAPRCFLGVGAYMQAYGLKKIRIGLQGEPFEGVPLWIFPNPSGLNANYQLPDFVRLFTQLVSRSALRPRHEAAP